MIEFEGEFGALAAERLETAEVLWLTTVRADGLPQPSPVWFYWDGATVLIFSQPDKPKLRNIAANPKVALNFNSDAAGNSIVILDGDAEIATEPAAPDVLAAYLEKYGTGLANLNMTPEQFAREYVVMIRVIPRKLRGFL